MNLDEILLEWSYRCPKGYPTIVDGKFVDVDEIIILNELLVQRGFAEISLPRVEISQSSISSNKTDVKEALVMVFYDCIRADNQFVSLYESLQQGPDEMVIAELKKTLEKSKSFNSDYGNVNIPNLHKFIVEILSAEKRGTSADFKLVNNGFSAANTIANDSKISKYIGSKKYATRGKVFSAIRNEAVTVHLPNVGVTGIFEDNWCPGDFYLMEKAAVPKADNLIEYNSHFAGPGYPNADILAISLKMEDAQAGKGTTFIKSVLKPKEVSVSKAHATNADSKLGKQYLEAKRRYAKNSDYQTPQQFYDKVGGYAKLVHNLVKSKNLKANTAVLDKLATVKSKQERTSFFAKNRSGILDNMASCFKALDPLMLGAQQTAAYANGFKEAYISFIKYLKDIGIKADSRSVNDFLDDIKKSKGAKAEGGLTKLLIKKADTYALAVELIKSWSDENKAIAKPFARLGAINNPLLAITMFAIAQHGANPNFAKVHGSNSTLMGTAEIFPAKSKVDEKSMVQSARIEDSPGAAGFDVVYNMKLNNVGYSTRLVFRFSTTQIRVEVEELEMQGK